MTQGPNIEVPAGFKPKAERQDSVQSRLQGVLKQAEDIRTNPRYQKQRRIGYGVGGGLAALATILNLRDNEEEQY